MKDEQTSLEKELSMIEKKGKRAHRENGELKEKIKKLDQLVYGKTKSPFKKLWA